MAQNIKNWLSLVQIVRESRVKRLVRLGMGRFRFSWSFGWFFWMTFLDDCVCETILWDSWKIHEKCAGSWILDPWWFKVDDTGFLVHRDFFSWMRFIIKAVGTAGCRICWLRPPDFEKYWGWLAGADEKTMTEKDKKGCFIVGCSVCFCIEGECRKTNQLATCKNRWCCQTCAESCCIDQDGTLAISLAKEMDLSGEKLVTSLAKLCRSVVTALLVTVLLLWELESGVPCLPSKKNPTIQMVNGL